MTHSWQEMLGRLARHIHTQIPYRILPLLQGTSHMSNSQFFVCTQACPLSNMGYEDPQSQNLVNMPISRRLPTLIFGRTHTKPALLACRVSSDLKHGIIQDLFHLFRVRGVGLNCMNPLRSLEASLVQNSPTPYLPPVM